MKLRVDEKFFRAKNPVIFAGITITVPMKITGFFTNGNGLIFDHAFAAHEGYLRLILYYC